MLEEGLLNLSAPEPLPGRSLPTGDVAFALQPNLMKPFSRKYLDLLTRICDYRFWRARRISADVFGIITNLWRVQSSNFITSRKSQRAYSDSFKTA